MERYPVAYLRRSSADADDRGDISRDAQEAAVRELAHRDGHNGNLRIFTDWDRSADEAKESKRTGFVTMLAAIEAGQVSAVYAYALDRLYRSIRTFVRLTDAAKAKGTRIVTLREGVLGGDGSPMAQAFAEITAVFSTLELRTAKARAGGALEARRVRGDHIGRVGYGFKLARNERGAIVAVPDADRPLEPVLQAVRETRGNILAACKLLNARGVPVPQGPSAQRRQRSEPAEWYPTPLRKIVDRNAPGLLPQRTPSGRRTPASSALSGLLVCHCQTVLTPEPGRKSYRCARGNRLGAAVHGRLHVSERIILPALKVEAGRLRVPYRGVEIAAESVAGRREAIRARLARFAEMYGEGEIVRARFDAEKLRAQRDLDAIGAQTALARIAPSIVWNDPPADLNEQLRALWRSVKLGPDMQPTAFEWHTPEWRS